MLINFNMYRDPIVLRAFSRTGDRSIIKQKEICMFSINS